MSEFMGMIKGRYEAKAEGFLPGGASLHSCMAAHGPDASTFVKASREEQKPMRLPDDSLAFMFESTYMFKLTDWALKIASPDADYWKVWEPIKAEFNPNWKPADSAAAAAAK
jgi:homogentisate 1,2-dioxygenase